MRLHDGSFATPLEPDSVLTAIADGPDRVTLDLTRGKARFEVVPSQRRAFSVRVGDVTVTVLGTVFTVERVADRVGVSVERGTVRVDWTTGTRQLAVGQSGWFPPLLGAASEPAPRPAVLTQKARARRPVAVALAESPATSAPAPTAPGPTDPAVGPVNTTVSDLLAAVDAARLNGRAAEGAAILRRVLREHATDQRAPLAAFTLGRLLLMELGQPREAALAFAQVRTLTPGAPFAEDALAREAEAWMKANELGNARLRAQEYVRLYPRGRRAEFVKSLIGIE